MSDREVTERDFRRPEFRDADPKDYEFRGDGKIVRKDRWESAIGNIRFIVGIDGREFEIPDVVEAVRKLAGVRLRDALDDAREVYASHTEAIQCLDYVQAVIDGGAKETQDATARGDSNA